MYVYTYIYIYTCRERERERERGISEPCKLNMFGQSSTSVRFHVQCAMPNTLCTSGMTQWPKAI